MPDCLLTLEKVSSILGIFFVFVLWILSRNFTSKDELKKELSILDNDNKKEIKSIYSGLNNQRVSIAELNAKVDNLIKSVDQLNLVVNDIREHLINYKLEKNIRPKPRK